ncbi:hypothetical protein AGMMS4952_09080 [Spirochaetia bacterium]|nr:hypothetical protein AGMMS4952_09080 [Spirochaetia bacterium]
MKKMLVLLLALAVAGGVFAIDLPDGLSISGEVKSGLRIQGQDHGNDADDIKVSAYNDDAGDTYRFRLNLGWAGDIGGTKLRFQARGDEGTGDHQDNVAGARLAKAFGWVNLLDKKIVIWGGHGTDDIYGVGAIVDDNVDGGDVARVEVRPITGLSIAWGLPIPINGNTLAIDDFFASSRIGAKYSNDFITIIASARLNPEFDIDNVNNGNATTKRDFYLDAVYAVKLPKLGPVGLDITGAFQTGDYGYLRIAPLVTFVADKFDAHVRADINLDIGDDKQDSSGGAFANFGARESDTKVVLKPAGTDPVTPAEYGSNDASIHFRLGAGYQITDTIGAYLNVGSDNVAYFKGNGLFITPGLNFAFGPNTSIGVYDTINGIGADDISYGSNDKYAAINNTFGIDFNWSF